MAVLFTIAVIYLYCLAVVASRGKPWHPWVVSFPLWGMFVAYVIYTVVDSL